MKSKEIDITKELEGLKSNYVPRNVPWSDKEIALLTKYRGKIRDADLAQKLGRTLNSVRQKAAALGLS